MAGQGRLQAWSWRGHASAVMSHLCVDTCSRRARSHTLSPQEHAGTCRGLGHSCDLTALTLLGRATGGWGQRVAGSEVGPSRGTSGAAAPSAPPGRVAPKAPVDSTWGLVASLLGGHWGMPGAWSLSSGWANPRVAGGRDPSGQEEGRVPGLHWPVHCPGLCMPPALGPGSILARCRA